MGARRSGKIGWGVLLGLLLALSAARGPLAGAAAGTAEALTVTWRASPPSQACAGPADAAGRRWYEPGFDDSAWTIVELPDGAIPANTNRFYRARLDLPGSRPQAALRLTAQAGSQAYVNGKFVGRWGSDCGAAAPVNATPPDTDLTPWLQPGANLIAIETDGGATGGRLDAQLRAGAGKVWTRYRGNPVVDVSLSGNWDRAGVDAPTVLAEAGGYRMWYASRGQRPEVGLAYSADGVFWYAQGDQPVLRPGPDGAWDAAGVADPAVIHDASSYKLYYSGYDGQAWRIGLATSLDGVIWTKAGEPVLALGQADAFDSEGQSEPAVQYDGQRYRMWYSGSDGQHVRIGIAFSADGVHWFSLRTPVLDDAADTSEWDGGDVRGPSVLRRDGRWEMWYSDGAARIHRATSPDGLTWTPDPQNPALEPAGWRTWDRDGVAAPTVIFDGAGYAMWYAGRRDPTWRIGYAASADGIDWQPRAPVVLEQRAGNGFWDEWGVGRASLIEEGDGLRMWYSGHYGRWLILEATSGDGLTWSRAPNNLVLTNGPSGSWDGVEVFSPEVLRDGDTLHMWYTGSNWAAYRIGYAASTDNGRTWQKSPRNPVLDLGPAGSWDSYSLQGASVLREGDGFRMWYTGQNGSRWRIGLATSPDGIAWTRASGSPVLDLGPEGAWDAQNHYWLHVIRGGPGYQMWYTAGDPTGYRIGYAESADGITWQRSADNPVTDYLLPGRWGRADQFEPFVLRQGDLYRMWYTERDPDNVYRLNYAWSAIPPGEPTVTPTPTATPDAQPVYLPLLMTQ